MWLAHSHPAVVVNLTLFPHLHLPKSPKGVVICCILLDSGNTARQPCFLPFARTVSFEELQIGRSARSTYSYRIHPKSNSHQRTQRENRHSSTITAPPIPVTDKPVSYLRLHVFPLSGYTRDGEVLIASLRLARHPAVFFACTCRSSNSDQRINLCVTKV